MRRILILTTITILLLLMVTACGQQAEVALPTRAALAGLDAPAGQTDTGETAVQPIETEERIPLPSLATAPKDVGFEGGLGSNITIAEGDAAGETSMLAPNLETLFGNVTFSLNTPLPPDVSEAQVWKHPFVTLDVPRAKTIAERMGFTGPLFVYALPNESVTGESINLDAAQLPEDVPEFHAFNGAQSLIITEGSAYFTDKSVPFDYETPRPFTEQAPAAESALQSMGLLDFPYILNDGWGHEVWVNRVLDGMETDYPEISAGVNENGRLAFAAYQPLDQLSVVGNYPLISAEAAWQQIQDGIDENILFTITDSAVEAENIVDPLPSGFNYWPREHQTGQEVHLYTYPAVYFSIEEGVTPIVEALNYTVQADDATRQTLADQVGVNIHFWGILDTATNTLALTGWEPLPELNPLIKNGIIQRQGEQTLLLEQGGSLFILPDAPADLMEGSQVNVFSWAARETGQAYPVLDWEGIDMQIAEGSGETIAVPEILPIAPPVYGQISIDNAELAYYAYPELKQAKNGRYQQSYLLLPVWQFTGTADNGDTLQFTVQATTQ